MFDKNVLNVRASSFLVNLRTYNGIFEFRILHLTELRFLQTKHAEDNFKCAVIVNDMAALNIDKSLIDQSALVQSDEVRSLKSDFRILKLYGREQV